MKRRAFLSLAAGGTIGLVASPIIWNTMYDAVYWTQSWGWIPRLQSGKEEFIPTVSKLCPSGTAIKVRVVDGRPVRALGNVDNSMSKGALTALAAAETQLLYSPARLKTPLQRDSNGGYTPISWTDAETLLKNKLAEAKSSLACISGDPNTTTNELLSALLNVQGSSDFYLMPGEELPANIAWSNMGGQGRIGYDLENSDFILAIGANILETWGTVARNRKVILGAREHGEEGAAQLVYAGPVQNNTAAGANRYLAIRPGTETAFTMGVAHLLIKNGVASFSVGLGNMTALAESYTPEKVAELTGVDIDAFTNMVTSLGTAERPLVIVGSELGSGCGTGPLMAGIAVNMLLGRVGKEGNLQALPFPPKVVGQASDYHDIISRDLVGYAQKVASGTVQAPSVMMIYEANPAYALPAGSGFAEALQNASFKVAIAGFMNETCQMCDLVLPAAMGLERFDDVYTPYGSGTVNYAIAQPVAKPAGEARPMGDFLLALSKEFGVAAEEDMPHLLQQKAYLVGADLRNMLDTGEVSIHTEAKAFVLPYYNTDALQAALTVQAVPQMAIAPVSILGVGTEQTGIPPFATRIITDYQLKGTYSVAQINAATAAKLGLAKGGLIKVSASQADVYALVDIFEGVPPDTLAMCTGLGHTAFDEFSQNKGSNLMSLTTVSIEPGSGLSVWGTSNVNVERA